MLTLTPEQIEYRERTLNQLLTNQARLEASLDQETRPDVVKSIEEQLQEIEAHISRLQDELSGTVVFDEPVADDLFQQTVKALAKEKFFLAKKYIHRLETIEPFYPGLARLNHEAETGQVSRRTRSIARGTASSYPGIPSLPELKRPEIAVDQPEPDETPLPEVHRVEDRENRVSWFGQLFQFHIVISCLVVVLLICAMFGVGGITVLQWLIEGG